MGGDIDLWNTNTYREVAPHDSAGIRQGTDMVPLQYAGFCTQDSGLWIHSHRDLLPEMAFVAQIKAAAL